MRIFISYSHQDEAWKNRVASHLGVLAAQGLDSWDDRRIQAGDDWLPEIKQAIAGCDVALLLISRHFLTSGFILGNEVPPLLQRREQEGIRVIPVILSPCQWTRIAWLKTIQARPKDGKALMGMIEFGAEDALSKLAGEIHDLVGAGLPDAPLLDFALHHLTLARCALYGDLLQGLPPGAEAKQHCEAAVSGLRASGNMDDVPRGLLTRAWLCMALDDEKEEKAALDEAEQIAARGGMKLYLADLALSRARLFRDREQLAKARSLVEECGYGRRLPELQDAENAAKSWP